MLSNVFLSGRLGEILDGHTRIVEVDSPIPTGEGFRTHNIPVRSPRSAQTAFFLAKRGSLIILKGRLEIDETIGIVVVLEIEEIFGLSKDVTELTEII